MSTAVRLLVAGPLVAVLGWAAATAIDVIRADDLVREASLEMSTWAAARSEPSPETWKSVRDKLASGIQIRPDPASHELLGMLGVMRRDDLRAMEDGHSNLVRALEMRPVSPYTWAYLMEAQYRRGEPAASLELALQRATHLGASEPGVQRIVADYGLALWPELTPKARTDVERMVAAGMRRNPLEMLRISDRRGRLEAACRHVVGAPKPDLRVGRACERWEITP
jgi:hypothetical protein